MMQKCPKCSEEFNLELASVIPESQSLALYLKSESELFDAGAIGKAITAMEEIHRGVASNLGQKVSVFIQSIDLKPHEITIRFAIAKAI